MADEPKTPPSPDAGPTPPESADVRQPAAPADTETADETKERLIADAKARVAAKQPAAAPAKPAPPAAGAPKAPVKKKEEGPKPTDAANHPLVKRLREQLGDNAVIEATEFLGQLSVRLAPARIVAACAALKRDAEMPFNFLCDLTCVHFPERLAAPFEIVYNLYSIPANARVRLKAATTEAEGIESVTHVWPTANWMEREVFDLFGVRFHNHPDLRRLLLPPDWEGYPLRKDYPLEFFENNWTAKHLPEFGDIRREQVEQRRRYGLEELSNIPERQLREIFRNGKEVMAKEK